MNKFILLFSCFLISSKAKSQWVVPKQKAIVKPNNIQKRFLQGFVKSDSIKNGTVYLAPLDAMPCLVPNTTSIVKIPNAAPNNVAIYIPNSLKREN